MRAYTSGLFGIDNPSYAYIEDERPQELEQSLDFIVLSML